MIEAGTFVSIPFKREGLSELKIPTTNPMVTKEFQFPSNGKVFPNQIQILENNVGNLSFNSLQTGRSFRTQLRISITTVLQSFNSLQTGRSFRTVENVAKAVISLKFQFPSNGKVFPNTNL